MDSDFFAILWVFFLMLLGIGVPILEKRSKKKKAQQKMSGRPPYGGIRRPSAGTSIEIPGRDEAYSPVKVDDTEEVKWPERNLIPKADSPGEDLTRSILAKVFGKDFMEPVKPSSLTAEDLPSSTSPDEEGVCSLGSHEQSQSSLEATRKASSGPAPVVKNETERKKIVDDPKKMVIYAEIMKPKYDQF